VNDDNGMTKSKPGGRAVRSAQDHSAGFSFGYRRQASHSSRRLFVTQECPISAAL